jgi:predicted AAA+ superfamily ATPase
MIKRILYEELRARLNQHKALILLGPRQVGKTTLINTLLSDKNVLFLNGDDPTVRLLLAHMNTEQLKQLIGVHQYVFID